MPLTKGQKIVGVLVGLSLAASSGYLLLTRSRLPISLRVTEIKVSPVGTGSSAVISATNRASRPYTFSLVGYIGDTSGGALPSTVEPGATAEFDMNLPVVPHGAYVVRVTAQNSEGGPPIGETTYDVEMP